MDIDGVFAHTGEVHVTSHKGGQRDRAEDRRIERVDVGVISLCRVQLSQIEVEAHHHRVEGLADLDGDIVRERGLRHRVIKTNDIDVRVRVDLVDQFDDGGIVRVELIKSAQRSLGNDFQGVFDAVDLCYRFCELDDHVILGAVLLQQVFDDPVLVFRLSEIRSILRIDRRIQRHDDGQLDVVRAEVDRDEVGLGNLFADLRLKFGILRITQRLAVRHSFRQRFGNCTVVVVVGRVQRLAQFGGTPTAVGLIVIVFVVLVDANALGDEVRVGSGDTFAFRGAALFCHIVVRLDAEARRHAVTKKDVGLVLLLMGGKGRDADCGQGQDQRQKNR